MTRNSVVLALACIMSAIGFSKAYACTNVIITKGASLDGSTLVTYAADSHTLYGELYYHPAMNYGPGAMMKIHDWDTGRYLGDIPQVAHTYQTVGNMNEYQVIIAETTFGGREELYDKRGILDYGSLIYIALQRSKTAREAIDVIVDLANKYGYASEGETFSIADKDEAWIMDLIGKGSVMKNGTNVNKGIVWVARRIPDGYICAHANQARITTFPLDDPDNCLYAPDVISFARRQGYFEGEDEDFDFSKAYAPYDFGTVRGCDARVWSAFNILSNGWFSFKDEEGRVTTKDAYNWLDYAMGYDLDNRLPLFIKPNKKVSVKDVADVMRDHYEGTPMDMTSDIGAGGNALPYRWRPLEWEYEGETYGNERAIATQQTGFWFVGQARDYLPDVIGGLLWFGVDDAATSWLTPIYTSVTAVPECFKEGNGDLLTYSPTSAFWMNNRVANACYKMYDQMAPFVREKIDDFEIEQLRAINKTDLEALDLYNTIAYALQDKLKKNEKAKIPADPLAKVKRYLTDYSTKVAQQQFKDWTDLEIQLLVKFMDGNVKPQNADGTFARSKDNEHMPEKVLQPGYTEKWKEAVVNDNGDALKVHTSSEKK